MTLNPVLRKSTKIDPKMYQKKEKDGNSQSQNSKCAIKIAIITIWS